MYLAVLVLDTVVCFGCSAEDVGGGTPEEVALEVRPGGDVGSPEPVVAPLSSGTTDGPALVGSELLACIGVLSAVENLALRKSSTCPIYFRRFRRSLLVSFNSPSTDALSIATLRCTSLRACLEISYLL